MRCIRLQWPTVLHVTIRRGHYGPISGSVTRRGWYSPTLKAMSSASFVDGFGPILRRVGSSETKSTAGTTRTPGTTSTKELRRCPNLWWPCRVHSRRPRRSVRAGATRPAARRIARICRSSRPVVASRKRLGINEGCEDTVQRSGDHPRCRVRHSPPDARPRPALYHRRSSRLEERSWGWNLATGAEGLILRLADYDIG